MTITPFEKPITPNWEGLLQCITRQGQPARVHNIELYLDGEVKDAVCARFGIADHLDANDPWYAQKREIAIQRFLGYDYVVAGPEGLEMPIHHVVAEDTAEMQRSGGRSFVDQHTGPITSWQEFEAYPWPDVAKATTRALEWYEQNLPDDMCLIGGLTGHFAENLSWLMGYETLCYKLYDEPDLVQAIYERSLAMDSAVTRLLTQFSRVKVVWGSDDMGYRSGTLISPKAMRQYVLPGHKALAQIAHEAGCAYILHSCGKLDTIMKDLIEDVQIDGKHSYEDVITPPEEAKRLWGDHISILGGLDMDFICRSDEAAIRQRTRAILAACQPGGGYCLGTGNTVANYIPLDHYLAMLDEGRRWAA
jgi:uroporphyrinogen decarboxylase